MLSTDREVPLNGHRMSEQTENGLVSLASPYSVDETVSRLQTVIAAKGIKIFALIDHSGEADRAGLRMPNTKVILFGNPKAGTPLMLAAPSIAIDLPLKILVAEGADGQVRVSYNSPEYLVKRHGLAAELAQALGAVKGILEEIVR